MKSNLVLRIEGMSCGHCLATVEKALAAAPGVEVKRLALGMAEVSYDPALSTPAQIAAKVGEQGYRAVPEA